MLDRGVIDQTEAELRLTNQHPGAKDEIKGALTHWFGMLTPIEELQQYYAKSSSVAMDYISSPTFTKRPLYIQASISMVWAV